MFDYLKGENNRNLVEKYKVGIFIVEFVHEILLGRSKGDGRTVGPWEVYQICGRHMQTSCKKS